MLEKVAIIGQGNVGTYLSKQFQLHGITVDRYSKRATENIQAIESYHTDYDFTLLCVPDGKIGELSSQIEAGSGLICHSSGTMPLEVIDSKHQRRGIFYPLMSLQADSLVPMEEIPFCIETDNQADHKALSAFCEKQGLNYRFLNSEDRAQLHLAAVISQNFSNALFHWAWSVLKEQNLPFDLLKPLLLQHLRQLDNSDPAFKQTGPAVRKDEATIEKHLAKIEDVDLKDLYRKLSQLIKKTHEKEL